MAQTTDIKQWIESIDLEDYNEVYSLYNAAKNNEEWGLFRCIERENANGKIFMVNCDHHEETLVLVSLKAKDFFLDYIEETFAQGLNIEAWYYIKRENDKED